MLSVLSGLSGVVVGLVCGWWLANRRLHGGMPPSCTASRLPRGKAPLGVKNLSELAARLERSQGKLEQELPRVESRLAAQVHSLEASLAQVRVDGLTGLADRRAFEEELCRRLAEWRRKQTPLAIMRIDVDHFERVEQEHGAEVADAVLRGVTLVLRGSLREMDLIARLGSEEFAILLPSTTSRESAAAAKRVRADIAAAMFPIGDLRLKMTVSVGVAEAVPGDHVALLLERADAALDESRRAGRNAVHVYTRRGLKSVPAFEPEGFLQAAADQPAAM
jgi:diguanylate cyclase